MKKTATVLATLLLLVTFTFSAFSDVNIDEKRMQLRMKDGMIQLLYNKASVESVKIEIKNENGKVIHRDQVNNKIGFLKNYDFRKLDEGYYTFVITDGEGLLKKEVAFFKRASIALIKQKDNKYRVLYGTKRKSKIWVQLLNDDDKVVFEDKFVSINGFSKVYEVSPKKTSATKMRIVTERDSKEFKLK